MKLVIGIINSDDANDLLAEITKASFQATKLATSGGFLKMGNVTVLVGVEDEQVDEVVEIFKSSMLVAWVCPRLLQYHFASWGVRKHKGTYIHIAFCNICMFHWI